MKHSWGTFARLRFTHRQTPPLRLVYPLFLAYARVTSRRNRRGCRLYQEAVHARRFGLYTTASADDHLSQLCVHCTRRGRAPS
jgi:hypothetical protein